jgi:integrase
MASALITTRSTKSGSRYVVRYRLGGRAYPLEHAGSFRTLKEARARRDLVAGELAAGRNPRLILDALKTPPPSAPGLEAIWDAFSASRIDVGEKARNQYRQARNRWVPILGATRDPRTVTADDLIAGIAELYDDGEGLAPSTIGQYLSNLAMVFDFADVERNPVRSPKVKLPASDRGEKEIPPNATWFAIRDLTRKRSRLAVRLQEACAFRVSEACAIEWGDLDMVEGMVRVRREATKTQKGRRWVPVPGELLDEMDALVPNEDRRADMRVLGVASERVAYDLDRACIQAGAPEYGTHALRHRRISLWLRHGIDPVQVARWSGHSKPSESLDTYGHVVLDPAEDEWRDFWQAAYSRRGVAPVWSREGTDA